MSRVTLVVGLVLSFASTRASALAPCDVVLSRTDGTSVPLIVPGSSAILFYEDRDSTAVNQALKDELHRAAVARGGAVPVRIVAVANIQEWDFFPARDLALTFIRGAERRAGVPILVDLRGALSSPPWGLPAAGSSVVLVDRDCREHWRTTGALDAAARAALLARVGALVAAP